ncbi:MAG: hypothetical protein H6730_16835 [Deltaproteobacteria bacterium]|nr:hypothetical protein [Deltaproteobacteria bacterium]
MQSGQARWVLTAAFALVAGLVARPAAAGWRVGDPTLDGRGADWVVASGGVATLRLDYELTDSVGGAIVQLFAGIGDIPSRGCAYNGVPPEAGVSGVGQVVLQAPTAPGDYAVWWGHSSSFSCADALADTARQLIYPLGTVRVGDARAVGNLDIDGQGHLGRAGPGQPVVLTVDFAVTLPDQPGARTQLVVGLGDQPLACAYDGVPGGVWQRGSSSVPLTAPTAPGSYALTWSWDDRPTCDEALTTRFGDPARPLQLLGELVVLDPGSVCAPEATRACVCPGGGDGNQACAPDGARWDACVCAGPGCAPGATRACTCAGGAPGAEACADGAWQACVCAPAPQPGGCSTGAGSAPVGLLVLALGLWRRRRPGVGWGLVLVPCLASSALAQEVTLSNPRVNAATEDWVGATGQGLLVEVDYALGAAETRRQIMLGVDGVPLGCLYDGVPGPQGAAGSSALSIAAPHLPGAYAVQWATAQAPGCTAALVSAWPDAPQALGSVQVGDAWLVGGLDLGGQGPVAAVAPGQQVRVEVEYALTLPDQIIFDATLAAPILPVAQLVLGLGDRPLACIFDDDVGATWKRGVATLELTAPRALGVYDVTWGRDDRPSCALALSDRFRGDGVRAPVVLGQLTVVAPGAACVPGLTRPCACEDGAAGAEVCADDGAAWGSCACQAPACAPGATRICACVDGAEGAQRCAGDGAGWEACACASPEGGGGCAAVPGEGLGGLGLLVLGWAFRRRRSRRDAS